MMVSQERRYTVIPIKDLHARFGNLMLSLDLVFVGLLCANLKESFVQL